MNPVMSVIAVRVKCHSDARYSGCRESSSSFFRLLEHPQQYTRYPHFLLALKTENQSDDTVEPGYGLLCSLDDLGARTPSYVRLSL
jgi:hypothetical protein